MIPGHAGCLVPRINTKDGQTHMDKHISCSSLTLEHEEHVKTWTNKTKTRQHTTSKQDNATCWYSAAQDLIKVRKYTQHNVQETHIILLLAQIIISVI
jgi:hypothetical protein